MEKFLCLIRGFASVGRCFAQTLRLFQSLVMRIFLDSSESSAEVSLVKRQRDKRAFVAPITRLLRLLQAPTSAKRFQVQVVAPNTQGKMSLSAQYTHSYYPKCSHI